MIINLLIDFVIGILGIFLSFLPVATLPSGMLEALSTFSQTIQDYIFFMPFDTMVDVFQFALGVEVAIMSFKLFNWTYNKIRGAG